MNTDPDFVELERLEIFHNYIGPYGDSVRLCRRLAKRLRAAEAERDRLRGAFNAMDMYFTSGNPVSVERATFHIFNKDWLALHEALAPKEKE